MDQLVGWRDTLASGSRDGTGYCCFLSPAQPVLGDHRVGQWFSDQCRRDPAFGASSTTNAVHGLGGNKHSVPSRKYCGWDWYGHLWTRILGPRRNDRHCSIGLHSDAVADLVMDSGETANPDWNAFHDALWWNAHLEWSGRVYGLQS